MFGNQPEIPCVGGNCDRCNKKSDILFKVKESDNTGAWCGHCCETSYGKKRMNKNGN